MSQTIQIKQGDKFSYVATGVSLPDTWTSPTAECKVNDRRGTNIGTLTVTLTGAGSPVTYTVLLEGSTATWPVGVHRSDILFKDAGDPISHTSTFLIDVQHAET